MVGESCGVYRCLFTPARRDARRTLIPYICTLGANSSYYNAFLSLSPFPPCSLSLIVGRNLASQVHCQRERYLSLFFLLANYETCVAAACQDLAVFITIFSYPSYYRPHRALRRRGAQDIWVGVRHSLAIYGIYVYTFAGYSDPVAISKSSSMSVICSVPTHQASQ